MFSTEQHECPCNSCRLTEIPTQPLSVTFAILGSAERTKNNFNEIQLIENLESKLN